MHAVCSIAVGDVTGIGVLAGFEPVSIWAAFAFWALVLAATLRRRLAVVRAAPPAVTAAG